MVRKYVYNINETLSAEYQMLLDMEHVIAHLTDLFVQHQYIQTFKIFSMIISSVVQRRTLYFSSSGLNSCRWLKSL